MDHSQTILQELSQLDKYEQIAREVFLSSGEYLRQEQYLYLLRQYHPSFNMREFYTPAAVLSQMELAMQFHKKYSDTGLTEDDFFPAGSEVVVEKLPRYTAIQSHKHQFFECAYVLQGSCIHVVDGQKIVQEAGTMISIMQGSSHEIRPVEDCLCLTIKVRMQAFLRIDVPNMVRFLSPTLLQCENDTFVEQLILTIYRQQAQMIPYQERMRALLFETLMVYVVQNYWNTVQYLDAQPTKHRSRQELVNYIIENYQTVTLHSLAKHFHYNETYLSDLLRKETGVPFVKQLRNYKLMQAAKLLTTTRMKVGDVCDAVGYKDPTQFARNFKEQYGMTPMKYRQRNQELPEK